MRTKFTVCCLLALFLWLPLPCFSAPADQPITPGQAIKNIGQRATVCGKVANTYYSCFVSKKPTFINFGKPYPDHVYQMARVSYCLIDLSKME